MRLLQGCGDGFPNEPPRAGGLQGPCNDDHPPTTNRRGPTTTRTPPCYPPPPITTNVANQGVAASQNGSLGSSLGSNAAHLSAHHLGLAPAPHAPCTAQPHHALTRAGPPGQSCTRHPSSLGSGRRCILRAGMRRAHEWPGRHTPLCVANQIKSILSPPALLPSSSPHPWVVLPSMLSPHHHQLPPGEQPRTRPAMVAGAVFGASGTE